MLLLLVVWFFITCEFVLFFFLNQNVIVKGRLMVINENCSIKMICQLYANGIYFKYVDYTALFSALQRPNRFVVLNVLLNFRATLMAKRSFESNIAMNYGQLEVDTCSFQM